MRVHVETQECEVRYKVGKMADNLPLDYSCPHRNPPSHRFLHTGLAWSMYRIIDVSPSQRREKRLTGARAPSLRSYTCTHTRDHIYTPGDTRPALQLRLDEY